MAGRAELHHEKVSTFLVASDKAQASQNEIKMALESNDDEAKILAMQQAIAALLNGEQLPQLFITIVRYVLPSENHMVQKLLLLYLVRLQSFVLFSVKATTQKQPANVTLVTLVPLLHRRPLRRLIQLANCFQR